MSEGRHWSDARGATCARSRRRRCAALAMQCACPPPRFRYPIEISADVPGPTIRATWRIATMRRIRTVGFGYGRATPASRSSRGGTSWTTFAPMSFDADFRLLVRRPTEKCPAPLVPCCAGRALLRGAVLRTRRPSPPPTSSPQHAMGSFGCPNPSGRTASVRRRCTCR